MGEWIDGGGLNSLTWVAPAAFLQALLFHTYSLPAPGVSSIPPKHKSQPPHQDLSYTCGFSETTTVGGSCATSRPYSLIWKSSASKQDFSPKYVNKPLSFAILKYRTTYSEPLLVPINNQLAHHQGPTGVWMTGGYI